MKDKFTDKHVGTLAADYVLGLLPAEERSSLSKHIARCPECSQLVAAERRIGTLVRTTVDATGKDQARIRSLLPHVSERKRRSFSRAPIYQQLAFAALFLISFFTGLNVLFNHEIPGSAAPETTAYVVTSSNTGTPAVATSSPTPLLTTSQVNTRVDNDSFDDQPMVTPAPAPIDALRQPITN
jgi:anti-sigma factor RsiW